MPKISALPPMTTADAADEAPIVDTSVTTTKKWTLTLLLTYLQSLLSWVTHAMVANGFCVQQVSSLYSEVATGTTTIPLDDTLPQNTEGTQFMTVTITPKSATNILEIDVTAFLSMSGLVNGTQALFQDSVANALAVNQNYNPTATAPLVLRTLHTMVAGTTSPITFKIRIGGSAASTVTFNGQSGSRQYSTATKSSMVVREYKAS